MMLGRLGERARAAAVEERGGLRVASVGTREARHVPTAGKGGEGAVDRARAKVS